MRSGPNRSACFRRTDAYLLALAVAFPSRCPEPQSHLCVIAADGSDSGEEAAAPMAP